MKAYFSNLVKEIRLPGSPGSSESPKEAGPKEEHTKVHHNYNTQDETQGPTSKITVSSKAIIYNRRADKVLPR